MEKLINKLKNIPWHVWVLILIILLGTFLRTYHFHDWLEFRSDQVRDAYRVDQIVSGKKQWPLMGPFLSYSGPTPAQCFHVGPIYYYFQIISAKIFGSQPDHLAYPDVFFSILSIPLLYLFLRKYFSQNISLGLTGIYSIEAYSIRYSRYAWSCNSIPFFVLLFLLSLFEILYKNRKIHWGWVIALGIAWGIGFQLHALTMIIFSIVVFLVFLFSMWQDKSVWKKWVGVFLIFVFLNLTQVVSEIQTNFQNTKTFFNFFLLQNSASKQKVASVSAKKITLSNLIKNDIDCSMEANAVYLTSSGMTFDRSNCQKEFLKIIPSFFKIRKSNKCLKKIRLKISLIATFISFLFSFFGYFFLLFYDFKEENKEKKYFLHLVTLYSVLAFLLMLPLSNGHFSDLRYFSFLFFVPFLMLGFLVKFLFEKFNVRYTIPLVVLLFFIPLYSNYKAISYRVTKFVNNQGMSSGTGILGEMKIVVNYMLFHSNGERKIYLGGDHLFLSHSFKGIQYLLNRKGIKLLKINNNLVIGQYPIFMIDNKLDKTSLLNYEKIGDIYLYKVKK